MKYIKFLFLLGTFTFLIQSCEDSENGEGEKPENNFSIQGKINGAAQQKLYVEAPSDRGTIPVADALINADGTFKLEGNVPGLGYYFLRLGEDKNNIIPVTIEPNNKLKINCQVAEFNLKPNASGTSWAKVMNEYLAQLQAFQNAQDSLMAIQKTMSKEDLNAKYYEAKEKVDVFVRKKMMQQPGNPYNIVLSMVLLPTTSFDGWSETNLSVLEQVAQAYEQKYQGQQAAETFRSQVDQITSAYNDYAKFNSGTIAAPEIAMNTPEGKLLKLSDLRGKVVLIDFWASWCGPCRKENPNVVRLYKKYEKQGFTVLSVSLDEDPNAWKAAIEKDGLIWKNHVSDLKGWKSSMPSLYGFEGIPFTVLVNKEGNIIGKELRGEGLERKLSEVFKN
ncbi:MAG: AhpC/TSA family protein [Flavobacteriales bacterium]|nr:AhpC/TSA family protein [Flavobacteriales bacterium]